MVGGELGQKIKTRPYTALGKSRGFAFSIACALLFSDIFYIALTGGGHCKVAGESQCDVDRHQNHR